jgi:oligopeptide/dipeptide ABC transporter ATP-binding protein
VTTTLQQDTAALLSVEHLVKVFPGRDGTLVRAVDGVSLSVRRGTTFGLVGESGSGKSTLSRCILRLEQPDAGTVRFDGHDTRALTGSQLRHLRSRIQVVFQDPHGSLNRSRDVNQIIGAPLAAHRFGSRQERDARVAELLDLVQLPSAMGRRKPRELSGGQAQRVAIARALALRPDFVVLDEAVSALDVSVRAQILNLLRELQRELSLTYLFISHDLGVVRYLSQDIGVMYHGRMVEVGPREELFAAPQHPYTRLLLEAVPVADPALQRERMHRLAQVTAAPEVADDASVERERAAVADGGCRFRDRCPVGANRNRCAEEDPLLVQRGATQVACHYAGESV